MLFRSVYPVEAPRSGYVSHIVCDEVGMCSLMLGGGRETKDSVIDLSVGIVLCRKAGDFVRAGEPIAYIHANDEKRAKEAGERYLAACTISPTAPAGTQLIKDVVG